MKKLKIKNYKIQECRRGFTMLEVIVSMAIIVSLISVFLLNYRGTDKRTELSLSAQRMMSAIRTAQNHTLGSMTYNGNIPQGGWGVHLDLSSSTKDFYIFADLNQNLEMDSGEYITAYGARKIVLPDNVSIASTTSGNIVDITFLPPDPTTNIWNGFSSSTQVKIQLDEPYGASKKVLVNFFGLIEVID